jgi:hypothetical protein
MYRQLRLCSNGGGLEAIPERSRPLDLPAVRRSLERSGVAVVDARVMLIVGLDPEVTVSRSGRLLFKTRDVRAAERALEQLKSHLGAASPAGEGARRPG